MPPIDVKQSIAEIMERMRQAQDQVPAIGIDFGTTNSTVARALGESQVEVVAFPTLAGETFSFRSVLYLQQARQANRLRTHAWAGPSAIEHYLTAENKGRLIQSLKSYLSDRPSPEQPCRPSLHSRGSHLSHSHGSSPPSGTAVRHPNPLRHGGSPGSFCGRGERRG